ncbi:hypothetical protein GT755_12180 [Herbidospora sp. NEAU-GS84]|uniref:DNA-binding protein n=1 Tax=Herbidospora solisilvae TaxID=2696284 RepID=A0A7C9JTK8_9ACTN|nr:hypothetical protein [Herbidospora solisilvae]NAS22439.1 hypothetical protein [Herbidospora solisilvae]
MDDDRKLLYKAEEAAPLLGVTVWFLKNGARTGTLPHCRLPGEKRLIRFSRQNLEQIAADAAVPAQTQDAA